MTERKDDRLWGGRFERAPNEHFDAFQRSFAFQRSLEGLLNAFLLQSKANPSVPMAGMTHMQHAQPILLSHFLLAHAEAFTRDITRLKNAAASADACPMGSGALAGNSFAIDRNAIARQLGFSRITANSLDAVGDRDFA